MIKPLIFICLISLNLNAEPPGYKTIPRVEVGLSTPSCAVIRHRLLQEEKLYSEWQVMMASVKSTSVDKLSKSKFSTEMNSLEDRINSAIGIRSDHLFRVRMLWEIPQEQRANVQAADIVAVKTPVLDWLNPRTQMLPDLNFAAADNGNSVSIDIKLTPVQFCLGEPQITISLGHGFEPPFIELKQTLVQLSADLTDSRTSAFDFKNEPPK